MKRLGIEYLIASTVMTVGLIAVSAAVMVTLLRPGKPDREPANIMPWNDLITE